MVAGDVVAIKVRLQEVGGEEKKRRGDEGVLTIIREACAQQNMWVQVEFHMWPNSYKM